jgi:hypothetical protein
MENEDGKLKLEQYIPLIFNDASKTISDLKSRQWTATTLSAAGIVGVASFNEKNGLAMSPRLVTVFLMLILIGYVAVMWRCARNIKAFKLRLDKAIQDGFPKAAQIFFEAPRGGLTADEGTIVFVAFVLVGGAFILAELAIWKPCWGN